MSALLVDNSIINTTEPIKNILSNKIISFINTSTNPSKEELELVDKIKKRALNKSTTYKGLILDLGAS
jgi:hypothetical protein